MKSPIFDSVPIPFALPPKFTNASSLSLAVDEAVDFLAKVPFPKSLVLLVLCTALYLPELVLGSRRGSGLSHQGALPLHHLYCSFFVYCISWCWECTKLWTASSRCPSLHHPYCNFFCTALYGLSWCWQSTKLWAASSRCPSLASYLYCNSCTAPFRHLSAI
jgi:hypothetical protein